MNTTDDLDTPVDDAAVIQPPPDEIDEEHDAFGGSAPVDGDTLWKADTTGIKKSAWAWMAAGFVAIAVASGAFFGMRNTADRATNASANGAPIADANGPAGAPNFPGGAQANQGADARGQVGSGDDGPGGPGGPGGRGPRGDGRFGILQSVNGSTLTLQSPDGSTIKVTTTASTQVTKFVNGAPQDASLADLTVGEPVMVRGTAGSDGTVAATAIVQGRPPRGEGGGGFGPPPDRDGDGLQQQQQDVRDA